jgi:hypothetical protein
MNGAPGVGFGVGFGLGWGLRRHYGLGLLNRDEGSGMAKLLMGEYLANIMGKNITKYT